MKAVGKLFSYTILAINAFFAVILLLSAYSPYIRPGAQGIMTAMGMMFPFFVVINILFLLFWLIFRSKYFFLPLITLLVCLPEIRLYIPFNFRTSNIPENSIKVLSYNVMTFDYLKTKNEENKILKYIKDNDADIVCIQDYGASGNTNYLTQKKIEAVLDQYPYHSITQVGDTRATNGMALYSKHPILSTKKINYPSQYNGSTAYEVKIGEDTLLVINNHLESNKLTGEDKASFTGILKDQIGRAHV